VIRSVAPGQTGAISPEDDQMTQQTPDAAADITAATELAGRFTKTIPEGFETLNVLLACMLLGVCSAKLIGAPVEVVTDIADALYRATGDPKHAAPEVH
jgi:hypothetical protein